MTDAFERLKAPADRAYDALESCGGRIELLPKEMQTLIALHTGQAIIDNGGLQYFFETDFNGQPDYSLFVDAYMAIGCPQAAEMLRSAIAAFPFSDPHLQKAKRNAVLANPPSIFKVADEYLIGNEEVWEKLAQFAERVQT